MTFLKVCLTAVASILLLTSTAKAATDPFLNSGTTPALNITVLDAKNGASILQCWRLDNFRSSTISGIQGSLFVNLGNVSNITYVVTGARQNAGLHKAPVPQFVFFLSGLIHITLPNSTDEAWIQGGKYGTILAQDTADRSIYGHGTNYVSDADTVTLAVALAPGTKLNHTVLHSGACTYQEMAGL